MPEDKEEDDWDFYRASGLCICDQCGKTYYKHPEDKEHLSFDGHPYLVILCNGDRVKL